jgi:hypothetical protein
MQARLIFTHASFVLFHVQHTWFLRSTRLTFFRPKLMPQPPRKDVKRLLDLNGLQLRYRRVQCGSLDVWNFLICLQRAFYRRSEPQRGHHVRLPPDCLLVSSLTRCARYYPADDGISVMEMGAGMSNGAKFLSKARVRKGTGRE